MIRSVIFGGLVAFVSVLPALAVADDEIRVCLELPSGALHVKQAPIDGSGCPSLATPHEVIGVWVFWTQGVSQFGDEFSGHELFSCFDDEDGEITVQQMDTSGADKGVKRKTYRPNAAPSTGLVELPSSVADTAAAGQVQWVVKGGGSGGHYGAALSSCRVLVGWPPS